MSVVYYVYKDRCLHIDLKLDLFNIEGKEMSILIFSNTINGTLRSRVFCLVSTS